MPPPIDILHIAAMRVHRADERMHWAACLNSSALASSLYENAIAERSLASNDLMRVHRLIEELDHA
jgi:hypothetical protein